MFSYGALTLCREFTETREETLQFIHSSSAETASLSRFSEWEYDPKSGKAWQGNHYSLKLSFGFRPSSLQVDGIHPAATCWHHAVAFWMHRLSFEPHNTPMGFPAERICDLDSLTCDFFLKDFLLLTICLCLSVYGYVHRLQMHWKTSDLRGPVITHSCEPPDGLLGTDLWFSVKAVWILLLSHPFSPCGHLLFLFSQ